jgi:putative DNA primase/helicase
MGAENYQYESCGGAEWLARALGGKRAGRQFVCRCPAHQDRDPSLIIFDGRRTVQVRCLAGCDSRDVIAALKARGLWQGKNGDGSDGRFFHQSAASLSDAERTAAARRIFAATLPATGTPVARYLAARGITMPVPERLRFHPRLKHIPSGRFFPAMVALVTDRADRPLGIHRTFLAHDGGGKAPVDTQKMALGPCRGGAVRLTPAAAELMVGEGIETSLSVLQAIGRPTWSALATSGLRVLELPRDVRSIVILADGEDAGEAAAQVAAQRWLGEGRRVRIARPPRGADFNDLLQRGAR